MIIYRYITLILLLFVNIASSQVPSVFHLYGKLDSLESGMVTLVKNNITTKLYKTTDTLQSGYFHFSGELFEPEMFSLTFSEEDREQSSKLFYIEGGLNFWHSTVDSFSVGAAQVAGSNIQKAYIGNFYPMLKQIDMQKDSLDYINENIDSATEPNKETTQREIQIAYATLQKKRNEMIKDYSLQNNASYISLWNIYYSLRRYGYSAALQQAYQSLHPSIQKKQLGLTVDKMLSSSTQMAIGKIFPKMELSTFDGEKTFIHPTATYSLINFWFSRCGPCIKELPELIKLSKQYKNNYFDIVSVTIDDPNGLLDAKKIIDDKKITWKQLSDLNGRQAALHMVSSFPTNILVNERGEIVNINISAEELAFSYRRT